MRRSFRFPTLGAFDLPDNISSCPQRDITTVPNQALTMLNNRTIKEQAAEICRAAIAAKPASNPEAIADLAWKYVYGRSITADEREQTVDFLQARYRQLAKTESDDAAETGGRRIVPGIVQHERIHLHAVIVVQTARISLDDADILE